MIQRLPPLVVVATAQDDGTAVFAFQPVAASHERWGVLTCPLAPASAAWVLYAASANVLAGAGQELLPWNGNSVAGPIWVTAMLTPVVLASGLVPGTVYRLIWHGYEGDLGEGEQAAPGQLMPSPAANTAIVTGPGGGPVITSGGGGGGLMNYATYESAALGGNPVADWAQLQGNFAYTPDETNFSFPDGSVSLFVVTFTCTAGGPDITSLDLVIRDPSNAQIAAVGFEEDGVVEFKTLGFEVSAQADTASSAQPFPWNVAAVSTNAQQLTLKIFSWAHP
jgi:hypothetical protein